MTQRYVLRVIVAAVLSAVIAVSPTVFAQTRIEYSYPPTGEALGLLMADDGSSTDISYTSPAGALDVRTVTDGLLVSDFMLTVRELAPESPTRDIEFTAGRVGQTATAVIRYDRTTGEAVEAIGIDPVLAALEAFQASPSGVLLVNLDAFWTQHADSIRPLIPTVPGDPPDHWCRYRTMECILAIAAMLAASAAAAWFCTPPRILFPGGIAACLQAFAIYSTAVLLAQERCRPHPVH